MILPLVLIMCVGLGVSATFFMSNALYSHQRSFLTNHFVLVIASVSLPLRQDHPLLDVPQQYSTSNKFSCFPVPRFDPSFS